MKKWFTGLRAKLLFMAVFPLGLFAVLAGTAWFGLEGLEDELHVANEVRMPLAVYTGDMSATTHAIARWLWTVNALEKSDERAKYIQKTRDYVKLFDEVKDKYQQLPHSTATADAFKEIERVWPATKADIEGTLAFYARGSTSANEDGMNLFVTKVRPQFAVITETLDRIDSLRNESTQKEMVIANEHVRFIKLLICLVCLVGGVLLLLVGQTIASRLAEALTKIGESLEEASSQVSSAAQQVASSSEELSHATTEQASSLEETAAAIEEMNSMVSKNTDNAKHSAEVSAQSEASANRGREAVEEMIHSIDQINQSNEQISEIVKVINEIGNKTKVINDIVFQTKLLSFNASVEAARAGEHGKGFAVVAEEVGNLAQMSGNAAKEISGLLENSIHRVETIVQETKTKVAHGTGTARQCGVILAEIVKSVGQVAMMSGEISTASDEQARGVAEITKAMNQLDQVTQQNATTSEEAAGAAEQLSAQADLLSTLVQDLVTTVAGTRSTEDIRIAPIDLTEKRNQARESREAAKATGKVVHLKASKKSAGKKGDDETPAYDDTRFRDI